MKQPTMRSGIELHQLVLDIQLGWEQPERSSSQQIILDITIQFPSPPLACQTDQLEDTYCYDKVVTHLKKIMSSQQFRLLEYAAHHLYRALKTYFSEQAHIMLSVKKQPNISQLQGGVSFFYGDEKTVW